jgi:diguanylate cyclase (GGDEF)-like protein
MQFFSSNSPRLQIDPADRRGLLRYAWRGVLAWMLLGLALCLAFFGVAAQITLGIGIAIGVIGERLTVAGRETSLLLIFLLASIIFTLAWTGSGVSDSSIFLAGPMMVLAVLFLPLREFVACALLLAVGVLLLGVATVYFAAQSGAGSPSMWQVWPHIIIFWVAHFANVFMLDNIVGRVGRFLSRERDRMAEESAVWEQAAVTDVLTGVRNRRGFMDSAERQCRRAQEDHASLALLMIDIDHFKGVNDTYGHAIGDVVIQNLADQLRQYFRSSDISGRLGGEEFCVLLTGVDFEHAQQHAERFRVAIAAQTVDTNAGTIVYTVSIGVAWVKQSESLPWLMHIADKALYRAKQQGRNCVVTGNYWDKVTTGKLTANS